MPAQSSVLYLENILDDLHYVLPLVKGVKVLTMGGKKA